MTIRGVTLTKAAEALPPHVWFGLSAVFHYLGPSFAVLLFPSIGVFGVVWLRLATAAAVFGVWTKPWRTFANDSLRQRSRLVTLGACLATMNTAFYLALARLPVSLVAAIEFVGIIGVAAYGTRTLRNAVALVLASSGVFVLIDMTWWSDPVGLFWALLNGALFVVYLILGHKAAEQGASGGVRRLGAAMTCAFIFAMPAGLLGASEAFGRPELVLAGIGVGLCSSVIPVVFDQIAMSRLPRASFAVMLALMPATAAIMGALVLGQLPSATDLFGLLLVVVGVAAHKPATP
jgi:inner membrane transporter RhtA